MIVCPFIYIWKLNQHGNECDWLPQHLLIMLIFLPIWVLQRFFEQFGHLLKWHFLLCLPQNGKFCFYVFLKHHQIQVQGNKNGKTKTNTTTVFFFFFFFLQNFCFAEKIFSNDANNNRVNAAYTCFLQTSISCLLLHKIIVYKVCWMC